MASEHAWRQRADAWSSNGGARKVVCSFHRSTDSSAVTATTDKTPTTGRAANNRFRRASRLTSPSAYSRVFKKAQRSRDKMFMVLYRDNGEADARLGLAISKKNCRLAVGRNRLKRAVRESFRLHRDRLAGLDVVVINQPAAATTPNKALFDSLQSHWARLAASRDARTDQE